MKFKNGEKGSHHLIVRLSRRLYNAFNQKMESIEKIKFNISETESEKIQKKQLQVKPLGSKKWIDVEGDPMFEELDRRFIEYYFRLIKKNGS